MVIIVKGIFTVLNWDLYIQT